MSRPLCWAASAAPALGPTGRRGAQRGILAARSEPSLPAAFLTSSPFACGDVHGAAPGPAHEPSSERRDGEQASSPASGPTPGGAASDKGDSPLRIPRAAGQITQTSGREQRDPFLRSLEARRPGPGRVSSHRAPGCPALPSSSGGGPCALLQSPRLHKPPGCPDAPLVTEHQSLAGTASSQLGISASTFPADPTLRSR